MRRLRRLSEAECYARCYGASETVRLVAIRPARPPAALRLTGEAVRRLFEERLETREPEAA